MVHRELREYGLTAGELGASGSQTLMGALLPVILAPHAPSAVWIGFVIGLEGVFALLLPYPIGILGDRLPAGLADRFGRRSIFLITAAPFMIAAMIFVAFQDAFWTLSGGAIVFFAALHAYITPLRTMIPERVPEDRWGRVQGMLGALHAGGLVFGLVIGGLLLSVWQPLPFLAGAVLVAVTTAITLLTRPPTVVDHDARDIGGLRGELEFWKEVRASPGIRWFLLANGLWSAAVDGIRPYVFLFAVTVLGFTVSGAALILLWLLGAAGLGSIVVGRIGDRFGRGRLLLLGALLTGLATAFGVFVRTSGQAVTLLIPAGLGAAALLSLPYTVFAQLSGTRSIGHYFGVYSISTGIARFVAPILVGLAIDTLGMRFFADLDGYPMLWPVVSLLALLSVLALWRTDRVADQRVL